MDPESSGAIRAIKSRSARWIVFWLNSPLAEFAQTAVDAIPNDHCHLVDGQSVRIELNQDCQGGRAFRLVTRQFSINRHTRYSLRLPPPEQFGTAERTSRNLPRRALGFFIGDKSRSIMSCSLQSSGMVATRSCPARGRVELDWDIGGS